MTKIYMSKKLEKSIPEALIHHLEYDSNNPLGKWNANLFYVSHKKCWIITNSLTFYTIFLDRIKISDLTKLSKIFSSTLHEQLKCDKINSDYLFAKQIVGNIDLFPTDNDKKIIGIQNSIIQNVDDWKYEFGHIDNWSFREINTRINRIPYKQLGWKHPREKMNELVNTLV